MRLSALAVLAALTMDAPLEGTGKNEKIMQAEAEWFRAVKSGNAEAISCLLAVGFVGVSDVGRTYTKQEWVAQYSHEWSRPLRNFSVRNQQARQHNDIAIVTGEVQYARGRAFYRTVYTHVWREVAGKLHMLALQESHVVVPAIK